MNGPDRVAWLRQMLEIRLFEEKVQELFMLGEIQGTTHLSQGQEAVAVGAIAALDSHDYLTITYRGHAHALARGMSMEAAFGELMGRTSGCCRGVGGSMHLTDFSRNLIGAFAIVGASYPVATGAAMSAILRGSDAVALAFCGDGATNIGTFHESLNLAAVWKAPVVFVIENNLYGEYTPIRESTPLDDLAVRAHGYAIEGHIVDGQDVDAVYRIVTGAIARARNGEGPTLIEAKTYRYRGHSRADPAKYRPAAELERWKQRDPITILSDRLAVEGVITQDEQQKLRDRAQVEVDDCARRAREAPAASLEEVKKYVYAC